MAKRRRVLLLFGGRSAEHDVSRVTAVAVARALDRDRYDVVPVAITTDGRWLLADSAQRAIEDGPTALPSAFAVDGEVAPAVGALAVDVVFPLLHGPYGEDGTVQGLLELADVAYVGAGHLGSAVGMDKDVTKRLLAHAGIPVVPWRVCTAAELRRDLDGVLSRVAGLGFPLFIKPANAGSSVGVTKVKSLAELLPALHTAFTFDRKVLAEAAVDAREIECAVLGNDEPQASIPGEIIVSHPDGFYSYDAKYVDPNGAVWQIPADISPETAERVRHLSVETFKALELCGMSRVDFFLDRRTSALYVNEVNTIPGFTAISMYPKMWEASGLAPSTLVTRLIELAIERRDARRALKTTP